MKSRLTTVDDLRKRSPYEHVKRYQCKSVEKHGEEM